MDETVSKLLASEKGLLAMDASNPTMTKRMETLKIPSTPDSRREFRELLVTALGLGDYISGAILYDETIHQKLSDGRTFVQALNDAGIIPGIKTDKGLVDMPGFPGEKIAQGLDDLEKRLSQYKEMGAKFTKFRTVMIIGRDTPTRVCMEENAFTQAFQAAISQKVGLVPVVEPEVLMDGDHTLERCEEVTRANLKMVFVKLGDHKVDLSKMILKTNMILPGEKSGQKHSDKEITEATIRVLGECVPPEVPGVVFLSGGDSAVDITKHLNAISEREGNLPWEITFSFERALEGPAMEAWSGMPEKKKKAQAILLERAKKNSLASSGKL